MLKSRKIKMDFQDALRYHFVKNVVIGFSLATVFLVVFSYYNDVRFVKFYLFALAIMIGCIVMLFTNRRQYKKIALVLFLSVFVICVLSILTVPNDSHFQEMFWMLVIVVFSFFVVKQRWGIILSIALVVIYGCYYLFLFRGRFIENHYYFNDSIIVNSFEFCISMVLFGYALTLYNISNRDAQKRIIALYSELEGQKRQVEQQSKEKTILLQEIHHRVKNNLQVIVSLLRMQEKEVDTQETKQGFDLSISRVMAMAFIHQKLYEKENLSEIFIQDYLVELMEKMMDDYHAEIDYSVQSSIRKCPSRNAVSLGLLVNELMMHSFIYDEEITRNIHKIELQLLQKEDQKMVFQFKLLQKKEDVSLIPAISDNYHEILEVYVKQLDGDYHFSSINGGYMYHFELLSTPQLSLI